jgi:CRP-like cAMP-binding protein
MMQPMSAPRCVSRSHSTCSDRFEIVDTDRATLEGDTVARKFASLSPLSEADHDLIRANVRGSLRHIAARTPLLIEGTDGPNNFMIVEGWANVSRTLPDGRTQITCVLLPGDIHDLDIFSPLPPRYSIVAITPLAVIELRRDRLKFLVSQSPAIAKAFWCNSLAVSARQQEWIATLGQRTALERLAYMFCELHDRLKAAGLTQGEQLGFPLTQSDLAEMTGLTPIHVNRTLQVLRSRSLVHLSQRMLTILDLPTLQAIAMFSSVDRPNEELIFS